ncbi:MAG TPA: SpoIID/LytB domain-containing protein [Vicinamibacterales bacterium]|nr:SpoIID/LytB domain-containing protein [Vicinamibacterales bacterium]
MLKPGGGYTVTDMPMETYVARVLAGEAVRDSQPAALEALAITIRTFALANRGRHRADGFDLCDQTHCQVVRAATAATDRAAQATAGRLLLRDGAPAPVYYSASCGGHTQIPSDVWPGAEDPSYLPSKEDDACQGAPAWTAELAQGDLQRALRSAGFRGELRDMKIASRNASGRVARLKLEGLRPDQISGQDLRVAVGRSLGWQHVKSTAFELRKKDGSYRFSGHGSGHGVGMCVIGSARLAERGTSAEDILARYFPGLEISGGAPVLSARGAAPAPRRPAAAPAVRPAPAASSAPEVLVSLPDDDEGERDSIVKQTLTARDDLARTLGVPAPRVTLRFHPTTDDYEQVTGQPWFTSGAIVNNELHLLPLTVLRDRGVLDRTIRHELVHLMADAALGKRPVWVREGAAIYFAGEPMIPGEPVQRPAFKPEPRASCPDDSELLHPVSVGALSNAYTRARACFAKQIQAGRTWRDVK